VYEVTFRCGHETIVAVEKRLHLRNSVSAQVGEHVLVRAWV
jgi:hypothetical protein